MDLYNIARKIGKINDALQELPKKIGKRRNRIYRFCSATESVAALDSLCNRLSKMISIIAPERSEVKSSLMIGMISDLDHEEKETINSCLRQALETNTLGSRTKTLLSGDTGSTQGFLNLNRGKKCLGGEASYVTACTFSRLFSSSCFLKIVMGGKFP